MELRELLNPSTLNFELSCLSPESGCSPSGLRASDFALPSSAGFIDEGTTWSPRGSGRKPKSTSQLPLLTNLNATIPRHCSQHRQRLRVSLRALCVSVSAFLASPNFDSRLTLSIP